MYLIFTSLNLKRKFVKLLLVIGLINLDYSLAAQQARQPDTIACKKFFLGAYRYYKPGGNRYRPAPLKSLLLSQPASAVYFHKYRAENWAAFGAGLAGLALVNYGQREEVALHYYNKPNPYLVASTIFMGGAIYFLLHTIKQYHRAVKAYNNAVRPQL